MVVRELLRLPFLLSSGSLLFAAGPFRVRFRSAFSPYQLRPLYNICTILVQYMYNW